MRTVLLCIAAASTASASPTIALDDPIYDHLARLYAVGRLPTHALGPLTEARVEELLRNAGEPVPDFFTQSDGWWGSPLHRGVLRLHVVREADRSFSSGVRARDFAVFVAL